MLVDLGRNDLSRVCAPGTRPRRALPRAGALLARHAPRLRGRRRARATGVTPFDLLRACFPAGTVSGAPKVRAMQIISELEGYRRGPYAGAVGYALPGGALDTCIAIRTIVLARRRRAACRRARGSSPTPTRAPSTRSACASSPRSRRDRPRGGRRVMILLIDNYDSFTYNLAHLFEELGAEVVVRRNDAIDADEAERARADAPRRSPPAPAGPSDAGAIGRDRPAARRRDADARRLPRPPGDRRGLRRRGRPGAARSCTARRATVQHDGRGHLRRACPSAFEAGRYHSLAATRVPDELEVSRDRRRRRGDGRPPPRAAGRRRPVPPRVGADAARPRARAQLPGGTR